MSNRIKRVGTIPGSDAVVDYLPDHGVFSVGTEANGAVFEFYAGVEFAAFVTLLRFAWDNRDTKSDDISFAAGYHDDPRAQALMEEQHWLAREAGIGSDCLFVWGNTGTDRYPRVEFVGEGDRDLYLSFAMTGEFEGFLDGLMEHNSSL